MKPMSLRKNIIVSVFVLASLTMVLLISGCAARAMKMTPKCYEVVKQLPYSVSVNESTGGIDPKPLWSSQISNTAFTSALKNALEQSGVFQTVTMGDGADYILDVAILNYDQPWNGVDMNVRMEAKWQLTNAKTHEVVWSNTFPSAYKARWFWSALLNTDTQRIQRAHELAVRNNIKEGIRRLSLLSL